MNEAIEISKNILIKPFEGYARRLPDGSCCAYPDPASGNNPWTIGYGSTGPDISRGTIWSKDQAEKALQAHLVYFATGLIQRSPTIVKASPARFAAVLSWVYNLGFGNYHISTFKKRVEAQVWPEAASECLKWNKARGRVLPGLTRRRQAEALMLDPSVDITKS